MGPHLKTVSVAKRFIILCPYLGESTIGGSTVHTLHQYLGGVNVEVLCNLHRPLTTTEFEENECT